MGNDGGKQQTWDGSPILLLLVILMAALVLAALLHFTGRVDLSVYL